MPHEPFDIDSLAAYLHMTPPQIARLADRGQLPGRKVGGRWRFEPEEVHHWLEQRIGLSDDNELEKMEGMLERSAAAGDAPPLDFAELLPADAVAAPLRARTRESVIREMAELAAGTGWLWDAAKMADAVRQREAMQPTALENGVALLHPRRPLPAILAQPLLTLGVTAAGIPFGGARGTLTDVFFLICSVDDAGHLRTLARISRLISDAALLEEVRAADDAGLVRQLLIEADEKLG